MLWSDGGIAVCAESHPQESVVAAPAFGGAAIIWIDSRNVTPYFQKLNSAGSPQWLTDGLPICRALDHQQEVRIAHDGAGGIYTVWTDLRSGVPKIYAGRFDANGQRLWALDGVSVCVTEGLQFQPALLPVSDGVLITWVDRRYGTSQVYAQKLSPTGALMWAPTGVTLSRTSLALEQFMTTDGAGSAIVAWTDNSKGSGDSDVYASRILPTTLLASPVVAPPRLRLVFASANPATHGVTMRLELPNAAAVRLDLFDAAGRLIRRPRPPRGRRARHSLGRRR